MMAFPLKNAKNMEDDEHDYKDLSAPSKPTAAGMIKERQQKVTNTADKATGRREALKRRMSRIDDTDEATKATNKRKTGY